MKLSMKALLATTLFALAGLAQAQNVIVVSSKSSVSSMTKEQVSDIYLGNTQELPGGGQASPLLPTSGAVRTDFFDKVLGKNEAQAKAIWSRLVFSGKGSAPRDVADSAETLKMIAANPNCIGVIEKSAVNSSVKVVFTP